MAKSRFEYVRKFELDDSLLLGCWLVVRLDGKGFHQFSKQHEFEKPNDKRALDLMSKAGEVVMTEFKDIVLAYGQSDEYSFVFRKDTDMYSRRNSKLISIVCSLFTSSYCFYWKDFFTDKELQKPPVFDGRVVVYPNDTVLRDYLSWRQTDCHINNLYNTAFWALVLKGSLSPNKAEKELRGTNSGEKNNLLFEKFNLNYNNEPEMFRKGTILLAVDEEISKKKIKRLSITKLHTDLIGDSFWNEHSYLLNNS